MYRLVPSDPGMLVAGSARMTVLKTPVSIGVGGLRLLEQIFPYDNEQDHDDCDARKRERHRSSLSRRITPLLSAHMGESGTQMCRVLGIVFALTLTTGGALWLLVQIIMPEYASRNLVVAACIVFAMGAHWLWTDYVHPTSGQEE